MPTTIFEILRLLERLGLRRPQFPDDPKEEPWVIEFRTGGLFQNLKADNSGSLATAQTFATKADAEAFMDAHDWLYHKGGMAIPVSKVDKPVSSSVMK